MKFCQEIFFFKPHAENEAETGSRPLFVFLKNFIKKTSYEVKARGLQLVSKYFDSIQLGMQ